MSSFLAFKIYYPKLSTLSSALRWSLASLTSIKSSISPHRQHPAGGIFICREFAICKTG
jgi:hypothetical protein